MKPTVENGRPATGDSRVARAMEEYLALLEGGRKPDRREFLDRYPEVSAELAECLDGLDFLHGAAPDLSEDGGPAGGSPKAGLRPLATLGDFRIVREVGRGGMGIVYEADQLSLGRRVALKVLPYASTMDPRQLQRFQNEAKAAASLHHEHVVPVHAVGCERGVHYYAMQFIDGTTLADPPPPDAMLPADHSPGVTPVLSVTARGTAIALRPDRPFKGQDYDPDMFALLGHPTLATLGNPAPIDFPAPALRPAPTAATTIARPAIPPAIQDGPPAWLSSTGRRSKPSLLAEWLADVAASTELL